jgi:hypothetical protein
LSKYNYKDIPLFTTNDFIYLMPYDEMYYNIVPQADAEVLKIEVIFEQTEATKHEFVSQGFANLEVKYVNDSKYDNFLICFNRDQIVDGYTFKNTCEVELKGLEIESITLKLYNRSYSMNDLVINEISIYQSKDVGYWQIADIVKEEVLSADTVMSTANFSDTTFTQYIETNVLQRVAGRTGVGVGAGGTVNSLKIENWEISFRTANLSTTDQEQFKITVNNGSTVEDVYFWYAIIGDHADAYKYLTTIDPREKYPYITDIDRDKFRFMVWSKESDLEKAAIKFVEENGEVIPKIILGAGTEAGTDKGKGFIYKDNDSLALEYINQMGIPLRIDIGENGLTKTENGITRPLSGGNSVINSGNTLESINLAPDGLSAEVVYDGEAIPIELLHDIQGRLIRIKNLTNSSFIPISYNDFTPPPAPEGVTKVGYEAKAINFTSQGFIVSYDGVDVLFTVTLNPDNSVNTIVNGLTGAVIPLTYN